MAKNNNKEHNQSAASKPGFFVRYLLDPFLTYIWSPIYNFFSYGWNYFSSFFGQPAKSDKKPDTKPLTISESEQLKPSQTVENRESNKKPDQSAISSRIDNRYSKTISEADQLELLRSSNQKKGTTKQGTEGHGSSMSLRPIKAQVHNAMEQFGQIVSNSSIENDTALKKVEELLDTGNLFLNARLDHHNKIWGENIRYDTSPLSYATQCQRIEIVELLCKKGADPNLSPNHCDKKGRLPIETATHNGDTEMVKVLLQYKAKITREALYIAIQLNHPEVIKIFLQHLEKNPDLNSNLKIKPEISIICDIICKNLDAVQNALNKMGLSPQENPAISPFHKAIEIDDDDLKIVQIFLDKIKDQNQNIDDYRDEGGQTPIFWALQRRPINKKLITLLIENRANVNHRDDSGQTPLLLAIAQGLSIDKDIIELLIKNGADVNYEYTNWHGKKISPLRVAMDFENLDAFSAIVNAENIQDVNVDSGSNISALEFALTNFKSLGIKTVEILLQRGANVNYASKSGITSLVMAIYQIPDDAQGTDIDTGIEMVNMLINKGANVNQSDKQHKETPLMQAVKRGHRKIVEVLLNNGANIDDLNRYGETALAMAMHNQNWAITKLLLDRGADINAVDKYIVSSVSNLLAKLSEDSAPDPDMTALLHEHGAKINAANVSKLKT